MLSKYEQFSLHFREARSILVCFDVAQKMDAIPAALALAGFLKKEGKLVDIVGSGVTIPPSLSSLNNVQSIKSALPPLYQLVISLKTEKGKLQELSYDVTENELRIFVTPKEGTFSQEDIATGRSAYKYDLIVTIGTRELALLGDMYTNHLQFFQKTPIINIDNHGENDRFGSVTIVDATKSSSSEVVYDLIKQVGVQHIDAAMAHTLLTGIIGYTESFRSDHVHPNTMAAAGELISLGADRKKIVEALYKNMDVATLKIWGAALLSLQRHNEGFVSVTIPQHVVLANLSGTFEPDDMLKRVISHSPETDSVVLLHEDLKDPSTVHGIISSGTNGSLVQRFAAYNASGTDTLCRITLKQTTLDAALQTVRALWKETR